MQLIRFDQNKAHRIEHYQSVGASHAAIGHSTGETRLGCIYFEPGGILGAHPAGVDQLFLVVSGEGWVSGEDGQRTAVSAGTGALWRAGEVHESGSDRGMTAIVIQASELFTPRSPGLTGGE